MKLAHQGGYENILYPTRTTRITQNLQLHTDRRCCLHIHDWSSSDMAWSGSAGTWSKQVDMEKRTVVSCWKILKQDGLSMHDFWLPDTDLSVGHITMILKCDRGILHVKVPNEETSLGPERIHYRTPWQTDATECMATPLHKDGVTMKCILECGNTTSPSSDTTLLGLSLSQATLYTTFDFDTSSIMPPQWWLDQG